MGIPFAERLSEFASDGKAKHRRVIYGCKTCGTHLTSDDEIVSTSFKGKTGPAILFNNMYFLYTEIS